MTRKEIGDEEDQTVEIDITQGITNYIALITNLCTIVNVSSRFN